MSRSNEPDDLPDINTSTTSLNARQNGQQSMKGFSALSTKSGMISQESTIDRENSDTSKDQFKKQAAEIASRVVHDISSKPIPVRQPKVSVVSVVPSNLGEDDDREPLITSPHVLYHVESKKTAGAHEEAYNMTKLQLKSVNVSQCWIKPVCFKLTKKHRMIIN